MGSEYFINSQELEDKVRSLLPSQGGAGAGFDLSASTQIIPVIDLTESAQGSNLRQDLQVSISHGSATTFNIRGGTNTDIITTTGYFRIIGTVFFPYLNATDLGIFEINLFDGTTQKVVYGNQAVASGAGFNFNSIPVDLNVFIDSGDSCNVTTSQYVRFVGSSRQIASIDGTLTNP